MTETSILKKNNWGRWGDNDEVGALNLITPSKRLGDLQTPRSGRMYTLGLPAQREHLPSVPFRGPVQRLTIAGQVDTAMWDAIGERMGVPSPGTGANEDLLITATHNGTHMDALCHVFHEGKLYNGFPADSVTTINGATRNGIEKIGGIAGRAVVLDVAGHVGVEWLESGYRIGGDLLEEVRAAQGTVINEGDILLVHTGWTKFFLATEATGEALARGQAGLDQSAVDFIDQYQISVVGSDNCAVEMLPCDERYLSVHVELIYRRGIHLLELLDLRELAADNVHECLLVVAPMKIVGGSGSPINPIAIA